MAVALLLIGATPVSAAQPAAAPAASQNYFDVHEYRVLGNTTLSNLDIETVLYPLLGDHKTLADVEIARAALEKNYHDRGYSTVFVDIPEQDVSDSIVRLKVTEGRLNEVRISGARYFSERKILAALPSAAAGDVPNVPVLQGQLSEINVKTADRSVVPILKAGPRPGTVDLALKVDDHLPFHGSLEIDNQNTPGTKPLRATASLSYTNLFGQFDSLAFQYQAAPQSVHDVNVIAANYSWGSIPGGITPSIYVIDNSSNVATFGTLGVLGKGQVYGAHVSFPLTDALGSPQTLTLGVDYKHFDQSIRVASTTAPTIDDFQTPISYLNLSLAYAGSWATDKLFGSLGASVNFGPRGAPNDQLMFANKRFKGQSNYFYVKLDSSLALHLPKGFQILLRADGQYAIEPLITNEDFAISGADGVRGYYEAEALADVGLKGSVQLQSPVFKWGELPVGDLFVFVDAGEAYPISSLPGEPAYTRLHSAGAGLNLFPGRPLSGTLTWADPMSTGPNTRRGDSRFLFTVRGAF